MSGHDRGTLWVACRKRSKKMTGPYRLRTMDMASGSSVAALSNAPVGQLPNATMKALGAKTQSLILAADLIWHF